MPTIENITMTERPTERGIERTYVLEDTATRDSYGRLERAALHVSVSHDRDRKRYRFTVDRQTKTEFGYRTVIHVGGRDTDSLVRSLWYAEPAARFSRKQVETLMAEYLRDHIEPQLPALLEYARGAIAEGA